MGSGKAAKSNGKMSKVGKAEGETEGYYVGKTSKVGKAEGETEGYYGFYGKAAKLEGKTSKVGKAEVSKKEKVLGPGKETKDKLVKATKEDKSAKGKSKERKVFKLR